MTNGRGPWFGLLHFIGHLYVQLRDGLKQSKARLELRAVCAKSVIALLLQVSFNLFSLLDVRMSIN